GKSSGALGLLSWRETATRRARLFALGRQAYGSSSASYRKKPGPNLCPGRAVGDHFMRLRLHAIQGEIELEHVDARFAQQTQSAPFDLILYQGTDTSFRQSPRLGYARHLEECRLRRNIRIKPAAGCGHQVDRDWRRWVFFLERIDVALDALHQGLAGRSKIRAHRVDGVVRCVDSLGRILWIR